MRTLRPSFFSIATLAACVLGVPGQAQPVAAESPFLPAAATATATPADATEPFQLVGIGVLGGKTSVCIYEAAEKRSRWIPVGESLGDLKVVSCDVEAESAVIRIGEQTRTLTLPKAAASTAAVAAVVASDAPTPASANASPADAAPVQAPVPVPAAEEEQAREARMFVTDLLEISMQQRKAYEEAQRKAFEQENKPPPAVAN